MFTVTGCPLGPIVEELDAPTTFVIVNWNAPTAVSSAGEIDSAMYPSFSGTPSGSNFEVDITSSIVYTWIDSMSNTATCTFNVRVQRPNRKFGNCITMNI